MFTIFIWVEHYNPNDSGWEQDGVYDVDGFDVSYFKQLDNNNKTWYARPDDLDGERFLVEHGII